MPLLRLGLHVIKANPKPLQAFMTGAPNPHTPYSAGFRGPGGGRVLGEGAPEVSESFLGGAQIRFNNPGLEPSRQVPELELACGNGPIE